MGLVNSDDEMRQTTALKIEGADPDDNNARMVDGRRVADGRSGGSVGQTNDEGDVQEEVEIKEEFGRGL